MVPRLPRHLRRAVRRLVADPDDDRVGAGAAARDRGAVGRRRRRDVRRLHPPRLGRAGVASHRARCRALVRRAAARRRRPRRPADAWTRPPRVGQRLLPARARQRQPGDKLRKLVRLLDARDVDDVYGILVAAVGSRRRRRCPARRCRSRGPSREAAGLRAAVGRRADDFPGPDRLSARRHPGEGRSRQHGGEPRGAGAAARSPAGRVHVAAAAVVPDPRRPRQVAAAPHRRSARPARR